MLFNRSVMYGLATILADGAKNQTFATLTVTRLLHTVSVLGCLGSGRITAYSECAGLNRHVVGGASPLQERK
jgi:hypothetical protein